MASLILRMRKCPKMLPNRLKKVGAFLDTYPQATLGFVDGSSLQNRPNHARMLATPLWQYSQEGRRSQPFFGFMPLAGRACLQAIQKADAWTMQEFLELIRKQNNDGRPMNLK